MLNEPLILSKYGLIHYYMFESKIPVIDVQNIENKMFGNDFVVRGNGCLRLKL